MVNITPNDICEITTEEAFQNINTILFDENNDLYAEESALRAVEKSFHEILEQNYPSFPSDLPQPNRPCEFSSSNHQIPLPISEFEKGLNEGMKFLPSTNHNELVVDLPAKNFGRLVGKKSKEGEENDKDTTRFSKKNTNYGDLSLMEGRKCKISVLHFNNREVVIDKVFLLHEGHFAKEALHLREIMQNQTNLHRETEICESLADLKIKTLLINCSQAIAINDTQITNQLIKQIREHSSPNGGGVQRMANIFVNALETRLNGTSFESYQPLFVPPETKTITDYSDAFHVSLVSHPLLVASMYFANDTILNAIGKGSKLHIIYLGTELGLDWPCLIHALKMRIGGPPKLRITNIEVPMSSYSPTERIEEVGRKFAGFSRTFDVPLEYRGICTKLEKLRVDDLHIQKDEVLIVHILYGFEYLGDEDDLMYDMKDRVLDIIRQINPHVFIQGIINGSFNSSFFSDRFKQMLLYSSALFDIFDATIPRGNKQRWFMENNIWARMAFNVIACEGSQRFLRLEPYKNWHIRNTRAGFEPLPLDHVIFRKIKGKVREFYNENFFIENDNEWLLLGWKGKVMTAFSTWYSRQTKY